MYTKKYTEIVIERWEENFIANQDNDKMLYF